MPGIDGTWDVAVKTPIGTMAVRYEFASAAGTRHGRAVSKNETTPIDDITVVDGPDGQTVTWRQDVTKPLRLTLLFEVTVHGDEMHGHSRAGRLPRSSVTGRRV